MVAFNFTRITKFLAPAMSCVSVFGTKSRGTFSVGISWSQSLGLNLSRNILVSIDAEHVVRADTELHCLDQVGKVKFKMPMITESEKQELTRLRYHVICHVCLIHAPSLRKKFSAYKLRLLRASVF